MRGGGDKPACYLITTINAHPLAPNIILGGGASPPPAPATRQPPTKHDRLIYGPTSDTLGPADYLLVLLHPMGDFRSHARTKAEAGRKEPRAQRGDLRRRSAAPARTVIEDAVSCAGGVNGALETRRGRPRGGGVSVLKGSWASPRTKAS